MVARGIAWAGVGVVLSACGRGDYVLTAASGFVDELDGGDDDDDDVGTTGLPDPTGSMTLPTTITDPSITVTDTDPDPSTGTTGPQDECAIAAQCDVADPCLVPDCVDGQCEYAERDADDDGFAPIECGGADCNDLNPNTFPGAGEDCFDGDDNDCNGVFDCFDPVCDEDACGCMPSPELCEGGVDEDCDTTVDCNDPDCLGTPACGCADVEAGLCDNGFDDDCDDAIDCDDPDCSGDMICTCMDAFETCEGGVDDDCDLLIDCADPDCEGIFPCTCLGPPLPESCDDGADNDCDGMVDCADPDCAIAMACMDCSPEVCTGGVDEDCDGFVDCADEACVFDPTCAPTPEVCNNGLDDDGDSLIDCEDPDCVAAPICAESQATCLTAQTILESGTYFGDTTGNQNYEEGSCGGAAGEAVFRFVLFSPSHVTIDTIGTSFDSVAYVRQGACEAGAEVGCDDDSGGMFAAALDFTLLYPGVYYVFVDGFTIDPFGGPNEGPFVLNVTIDPDPDEVCDDGLDNDGDVYVDCADPDCTSVGACAGCNGGFDPEPEFGPGRCTDGVDNDCDGTFDCEDEDCSASDYYVTECCNGTDQNGNGFPDDFNCRCNNDLECSDGQICYDHTANVCGFQCTFFFGDVCPFVAPGSSCNEATQQCEFPP